MYASKHISSERSLGSITFVCESTVTDTTRVCKEHRKQQATKARFGPGVGVRVVACVRIVCLETPYVPPSWPLT
jgi:hypothetical protein